MTFRTLIPAIASLLVVACGPRQPVGHPPPLGNTPAAQWTYAAYLLGRGDAAQARAYLEPLASGGLDQISNPSLLLRDLAEARLFSGDARGASQAATQAKTALQNRPTTAQFRDDDRYLFQRTLDALEAAGNADANQLEQLATDEQRMPSADAWYLLGWVDEQRGDTSGAQAEYRGYLARAPQWSFLRQAVEMRRHAQTVVQ